MQADVFSFGCIMYEIMCGTIVSQLVVGPTGDDLAATVYSAKVLASLPHIPLSRCCMLSMLPLPHAVHPSLLHAYSFFAPCACSCSSPLSWSCKRTGCYLQQQRFCMGTSADVQLDRDTRWMVSRGA